MSHPVNDQIKETILNEVESMSISNFQNAVEESGISGNTVIDEMVENLVDYRFEQRSTSLMELADMIAALVLAIVHIGIGVLAMSIITGRWF